MDFKSKIGISEYNGAMNKMLLAKSKTMTKWASKQIGAVAVKPQYREAVPAIFMDEIFVGEAELYDLAEREGCPSNTYHCVVGTQHATIYLTHFIEMHEKLNKCNVAIFDTSSLDTQKKIRDKNARIMAKMTDKAIRKYDRTVLGVIESTAPRMANFDTITVDNILQKVKDANDAVAKDPNWDIDKSSLSTIIPAKYERMFEEAYIKLRGITLTKEEFENGIVYTKFDGIKIEFWEEASKIIVSTSDAWMHVLACFNGMDAIEVEQVKSNLEYDLSWACGGGYPRQYIVTETSEPVIKEIVVIHETTPAEGMIPEVVDSPYEQEGFRIHNDGAKEKYEKAVSVANKVYNASEIDSTTYNIYLDTTSIFVEAGTVVDKTYLVDNAGLRIMEANNDVTASVEYEITDITAVADKVDHSSVRITNDAGMLTELPYFVVGKSASLKGASFNREEQLTALKKEADDLGVSYNNNIGIDKLAKKIEEHKRFEE